MPASIIPFPSRRVLSRVVIEATIERLIYMLDNEDEVTADLEPDEGCEADFCDDEVLSPAWHICSLVKFDVEGRRQSALAEAPRP